MLRAAPLLSFACCLACHAGHVSDTPAEPASDVPREIARASFELRGPDDHSRTLAWTAEANMIVCRHDAEPERGDYLWIRLAETAASDGDAGVRLDIDVCRLGRLGADLPLMPAGQHGSHCAATPGFAIWWHEGDAAFNTGTDASAQPCTLELDFDHVSGALRGTFACTGLTAAEGHADTDGPLTLASGSFACTLEPMKP